jgi:putative transcriptional regulator
MLLARSIRASTLPLRRICYLARRVAIGCNRWKGWAGPCIEARLDDPMPAKPAPQRSDRVADVPGLPAFVRSLPASKWKWVAPNLHLKRLALADSGDTRVFLLKSGPGTRFLPHRHTGPEMTTVLTGSFSHDGGHYGPGDFDFGDAEHDHEIVIGPEGECISLVAMQGELKLQGLLGRMVQPFVSI